MRSKLGPYHVVLTTLKTSPENNNLTLVEMQQLLKLKRWIPRRKFLAQSGQYTIVRVKYA